MHQCKNGIVGLVMVCAVFSSGACWGEGKLHLVLGGDTALMGQHLIAVTESQEAVLLVLASSLPRDNLVVHSSKDVSGKWLQDTVKELNVDSGDSILIYYVGHGSYDVLRKSHKLDFTLSPVYRDDIEKELAKHQVANLRCLITESCATVEKIPPTAPAAVPGNTVPSGMRRLFFESTGFLNVNACDWGQAALANFRLAGKLVPGGAFTRSLTTVLRDERDSKTVTWQQVFATTADNTRKTFREVAPNGIRLRSLTGKEYIQRTQDPVFIGELPSIRSEHEMPQQFKMGVEIAAGTTHGVVVKELTPVGTEFRMTKRGDLSGQPWRLLKGDVILQLGGRATDTPREFQDAMKLRKPATWMKVMDGNTGETDDYEIVLTPE